MLAGQRRDYALLSSKTIISHKIIDMMVSERYYISMPPKIKQLIKRLERAGFVNRGGKGSHRNFVHPKAAKPISISGKTGDDALHYQERDVKKAIEESKK